MQAMQRRRSAAVGAGAATARRDAGRLITEQMLVRMRDKKSDIWKKIQRNVGQVGGSTQRDVRSGGGVSATASGAGRKPRMPGMEKH